MRPGQIERCDGGATRRAIRVVGGAPAPPTAALVPVKVDALVVFKLSLKVRFDVAAPVAPAVPPVL